MTQRVRGWSRSSSARVVARTGRHVGTGMSERADHVVQWRDVMTSLGVGLVDQGARSVAQAACRPPVPAPAGQAARGRRYHRTHRLEDWKSHARTVVRECCKGDDESQWERGKFDPPLPKNPLTDGHQNLCR